MWFWKVVLPLGALFVHEWWVPAYSYQGYGVLNSNFFFAYLLIMLVNGTHFNYWTEEKKRNLFNSNLHVALASLGLNIEKTN